MCRMIAAPMGVPGRLLIEPFLRIAQGRNALNERNTEFGKITHGDGWGGVYEQNGELQIHRSIAPCWEDPSIRDLREKTVFLLHARRASAGGKTLRNVHPFEQEIDGARWFFCHNGTVRDELPIADTLTKDDPTDSEKVFHQLLPYCAENNVLAGLRHVLAGVRDFTSLNSFLLGPDDLWVVGLHAEETSAYYSLSLAETEAGPIISSEPLAGLGSTSPIPNKTILRIDRRTGEIEAHPLG